MDLILTSDFPSTANPAVCNRMRRCIRSPKIAWISPFTRPGRDRYPSAQELFASCGFPNLEYCDIDEEPDDGQLARLDDFDIIYLTGGDPIRFRHNIERTALRSRLQKCLEAGRLIMGASGGAMQLTANVSLFRLTSMTVEEVIADRDGYKALGFAAYELLPHLNRFEPPFLERVRRYSEWVSHDIIAVADGAATLHASGDRFTCVGRAARFRRGIMEEIQTGE